MKAYQGKVKAKKMDKTATVQVVQVVAHPLYLKRYKRLKIYHVHDELGSKVGQIVRFVDCKPVSKLKKWKIIEILDGEKSSTNKKDRDEITKKQKKEGKTKK